MTKLMLIGVIAVATAGVGTTRSAHAAMREDWQGFMVRAGLQVPISVELAAPGAEWTGRIRVGDQLLPLEHVRMTGAGIHFELPGGGTFDGAVAGQFMAGSVSGSTAPGSFALARQAEPTFEIYPSGP